MDTEPTAPLSPAPLAPPPLALAPPPVTTAGPTDAAAVAALAEPRVRWAGIVWGADAMLAPRAMDRMIDSWCGTRPTIVVVSACYSGVFVPVLAQPNRMIMTAARRDRSSFGCSADATHPYFDGCVLEAMNGARDFLNLSMRATACVNRRERDEGLRPPSEPQTYVGAQMQTLLPFLSFQR